MKAVGVAVVSLFLLAAAVHGDANLPDLGPIVISVFPLGARQGETLDVEILGRNLNDTRDIAFSRPDIRPRVVSPDSSWVKARIPAARRWPGGWQAYRNRK